MTVYARFLFCGWANLWWVVVGGLQSPQELNFFFRDGLPLAPQTPPSEKLCVINT